MKLPKYLMLLVLSFILVTSSVFAQTFESMTDDVTVTAVITEDLNSTIEVSPLNVEIYEEAIVTVTIRDTDNNPLSGHYIELVAPDLTFTQPTQASNSQGKIWIEVYSANTGTYSITANDITDPALTIDIIDSATLYVIPVQTPFLLEEPTYTKGLTNTLFWSSIGSGYQYLIQVSENSSFSTIKNSSGWIAGTMFEFQNLENEKMYFYRVKAKNAYGGESSWSNVRYSVQDNEAPVISLISISEIDGIDNVKWESNYEVTFTYEVEDNLSLGNVKFYCIDSSDNRYECGNTTSNGNVYTTVVKLGELEQDGINDLFLSYSFCVWAIDSAENSSQNCDITIDIPKWTGGEEEEPPADIPTTVERIIREVIDNTQVIMDELFGDLDNYELQDITTTTTVATVTFGLGSLLGGLMYLPAYLLQFILSLLSWLGLRSKGKLSGYVYDSKSKEPISQAVVRVYDENRHLVWTDVTDSRGFFKLGLDNGNYVIKVTARNYKFPSETIFGKADYPLENVYHGENFSVVNKVMPEFSIPLDSVDMSKFEKVLTTINSRFRVIYKIFSVVFFVLGLIFTLYTYNINPNWFNFVIILLYIPSFVLVIRGLLKKSLEYGVVTDDKGNPLSDISVGLRDNEYSRIVAKRNTDGKGRYRFVIDKGNYSLEILDTKYEVVSIEEEKERKLSDGSVLIALDTVIRPIKVEK
ncbi:MAG: carboxypeptidase regulatory-like domain-containing protein [Candidatus Dojkabacteria bacterium]|nr:carboxypeptidase regulatory-like domain-containing protein [Candidatus Dojkabacteria bacterium]